VFVPEQAQEPPLQPPNNHPYITPFYHPEFATWTMYGRGIADVVGFWFEWQVFGGVLSFKHGGGGGCGKEIMLGRGAGGKKQDEDGGDVRRTKRRKEGETGRNDNAGEGCSTRAVRVI